ncbi:conserved hypothetical protein [Candida tropicalis MYA-3404]|uniref:Uncharacterized protein n=1 Tax=Candida tropicalis (strain ATCC MYA-3404 / T1) TaxID=294747 RepID=C5ME30_CANTT|nr:conserved hypothetical protein [Candida tropicalis MYA-3404]EER31540.1 conserved hypothetical protein [Candida tropicalis MYA-3404]KAG4405113.1 hypothetical protein JTP64_005149 [Candida tropicalis]MCP8718544.1 hypothetical protein [Asgard group archaeon]
MLRTALGSSKHSTAFRRAMAKEISPLRSYSVEQQTQQPISRLTTTKKYLKNLQTENSKESEKMLKIFRKAGALSIVAVLGSLGYAVYEQNFKDSGNTEKILNREQLVDMPIDLSQDIRYQKRGD